jgi:hypothetical protein
MKCNLIIPGFAKSGTASLHSYLAMHPDICMAEPKEPSFFAMSEAWKRGAEWYDTFFDDRGQPRRWYGESSTIYSIWEPALERIKTCLTNPKLIVLLRHPVQRLLSHYKWYWAYNFESRSLLEALQGEEEAGFHPDRPLCYLDSPVCPWVNPYGAYRRASYYSYYCPMMERVFGKRDILYLNSQQLFDDPQATLTNCFRFLGLEDTQVPVGIRANATDDVRLQRFFGLNILLKPFSKGLRDKLDPGGRLRDQVKDLLGQKKRKPQEISEADKKYLTVLLAEDIAFYERMFRDSPERGPHLREESTARI